MTKTGKLSVQLKSDSMFLGRNVPIQVRDSNMRLVKKANIYQKVELPEGLYEVSAVLGDGNKHRELVHVKEGDDIPVELGAGEEMPLPESHVQAEDSDAPEYVQTSFTKKLEAQAVAGVDSVSGTSAELLDVTGATIIRQTRTLWFLRSEPNPVTVPTARIRINDREILLSLPVSPEHGPRENNCVVKVEETRREPSVNAWISTERTVANALQNMLASGYLLHAADVADDAVELLQYKYSDPTGAALGALILHKVGRLKRWAGWVGNLARDFGWLPDGKILYANLLYEDKTTRPEALDLAIQASKQRILYSDSYSLLLDLLRRWSREDDQDAIKVTIWNLATHAPNVNWDSICLNNFTGEDE